MEKGNSISKMMTVIGKVKYKNFNKIPNFILALCKHIAAIGSVKILSQIHFIRQ